MSTLPAKYEEARRALAPHYRDHTIKSPPLTGKEVRAMLASIAEWFPQAFVSEKYLPHRPLKIGIQVDLQVRCPALSERERGAVVTLGVAGSHASASVLTKAIAVS